MILVTGATGTVGRPLVSLLVEAGAQVRALSRNPETADLPAGVEVARTEDLPMDGVTSVFFVLAAFPDGPAEVIEKAKAAGVRRIVALSSFSVHDQNPKNGIAIKHRQLEQEIRDSGLEWTFLRPAGGFAITALEWAGQIRGSGIVRFPFGRAHTAPVHERDIADVAALALLGDDLVGATPQFSGPESLTYADRARIIGEALGRELRFQEISADEAREDWRAVGIPPHAIEARLGMFAQQVDVEHPIDPIEPITGKPARTFAQWAADHADDFR
ncbi:SDR family oxidoreductase [Saccharopolyspora taberi]|uniref:NAD(P)H-binding protein n=1 Tax=Saccharopolyspora taberi TaxID=60895 RepID=A0ABN3VDH7_9PSEU